MKLTPGQVREVLQLPQETFRHWKTVLPPLAGRNGYRPCFSHGDLFAMAVVKALTNTAGIRIGSLSAVAVSLFTQCDRHSWAGLERSILVLDLAHKRANFAPDSEVPQFSAIGIMVACRPIVAELRKRLLMDQGDKQQGTLRFPPAVVASERRREKAS